MSPVRKKVRQSGRVSRQAKLPADLTAVVGMLAGMPEAALVTRDRWRDGGVEILYANPAFAALTGHPASSLPGQSTRLLYGPKTEMPPHRAASWRRAGEGWLHRKDGSPFYAAWTYHHAGRRRRPGCLIGIYRNRSEMLHLQEALQHAQRLDAVGQLAGGVAHDINNLLSIINGFCELMRPKLAAVPAVVKDFEEVHRAGLKAAAITRQILEFSRRRDAEVGVVNANTLIREITGILRRAAGEAIEIELRLASDLGNMRIDPTQFQQVLLNLCFNARDAMPQGGRLTIRTGRRERRGRRRLSDTGWIVVEVSDTGAGMTPEVRRRIFEPFFTTKSGGTGYGLATVLGIVRRAGGTITVESASGAGSRFEMNFPETAEPVPSAEGEELPPEEVVGRHAIWLLEPDVLLRKMVAGILTVEGYKVGEFATPEDARTSGADELPALLIVDGVVEEAGDFARDLLRRNPRLRLLDIAAAPRTDAWPDFPAGAVASLPKPFALSALLSRAREQLEAAR